MAKSLRLGGGKRQAEDSAAVVNDEERLAPPGVVEVFSDQSTRERIVDVTREEVERFIHELKRYPEIRVVDSHGESLRDVPGVVGRRLTDAERDALLR